MQSIYSTVKSFHKRLKIDEIQRIFDACNILVLKFFISLYNLKQGSLTPSPIHGIVSAHLVFDCCLPRIFWKDKDKNIVYKLNINFSLYTSFNKSSIKHVCSHVTYVSISRGQ